MSAKRYVVFTALGSDRPGIVNEISSVIHAGGANLEDSRMAILGGEFAIILLVSGDAEVVEATKAKLGARAGELGLLSIAKDTGRHEPRDYLPYRLRVTGVDRPGIVHSVTAVLATRGVNVASLESRVTNAPLSGTAMFVLEASLQIPSQLALGELRKGLATTCDEENLDFALESGS